MIGHDTHLALLILKVKKIWRRFDLWFYESTGKLSYNEKRNLLSEGYWKRPIKRNQAINPDNQTH